MEHDSMDTILTSENLVNAVQNEPTTGIWNTNLNSPEEGKELAWTRNEKIVLQQLCSE